MNLIHLVAAAAAIAGATDDGARGELEKLRVMDRRLAAVGYRLATANAVLCPDLMPATGMAVHAIDQYAPELRDAARAAFGFEAPVAVAAVVADGPAARAGVRADDGVTAVAGVPLSDGPPDGPASTASRDRALALLEAVAPGATLTLRLVHDGQRRDAAVASVPACRARFEVVIDSKLFAQADATVVQVSSTHFERLDDDGIAVTAAHELAHVILRHRVRLEAAGVGRGLSARFGRDRRLTRQVEDEADALSVHLLRNAGYDPAIAVTYWQQRGAAAQPGPFGYRTHASPGARAAAIAAEIAAIPAHAAVPFSPPILSNRQRILQ